MIRFPHVFPRIQVNVRHNFHSKGIDYGNFEETSLEQDVFTAALTITYRVSFGIYRQLLGQVSIILTFFLS